MTYSIDAILDGLAGVLAGSGYSNIYISNRQQGVNTPCFFISLMPSSSEDAVDGRVYNDLAVDIVFLQDNNIINAMDNVYTVLGYLDEHLITIPYTDSENADPIPLHTYDREYHMEEMDLHYQLHFKNRMHIAKTSILMASLEELTYEIKRK